MTAIIVDDEVRSHTVLKSHINNYHQDVQILDSGYNIQEGFDLLTKYQPDLVFLDIEMPDGTGFDLLKRVGKPDFSVIFISGHESYARHAVKFGALDYLLKPIAREDLELALTNAREKIKEKISIQQLQLLLDAFQNFQDKKLPSRFCISTKDGMLFKFVEKIIHLEADENYTHFTFHEESKKITSSLNLGEYIKQFEPYDHLMQVHRSHLVNLNFVEKFIKTDGILVMTNGSKIRVSKPNRDKVTEKLHLI